MTPVRSRRLSDVLSARTAGRFASVLAMIVLIGIAGVRWNRLVSSFESALLTPIASILSPEDARYLWTLETVQFWIAAFTWGATFIGVLLRIIRGRKEPQGLLAVAHATPRFRRGMTVLSIFLFIALTGPLLAPADPFAQGPLETNRLIPPGASGHLSVAAPPIRSDTGPVLLDHLRRTNWFLESGLSTIPAIAGVQSREMTFLLGSDAVGRDVFSRLFYGTRVSLGIGLTAALGALLLGSVIGFISGFAGGLTDRMMMWASDVFLAIPTLFLIIALVFFIGGGVTGIIVVLTVSGWMRIARLVRGEVLHFRDREFIQTARLLGQSPVRIIRRHLIPNVLPILISAAVLQVSDSMLAEASLGFLGFGVQPPVPSWGNMLGDSLAHLERAWWLAAAPGLFLTILMTALHVTSEELQEFLRL
jgi:peptide/nickel transport system permease protein